MIERSFHELGFSANETSVFLLLAESGKSTANQVAKRGRLPRTTVYSVLDGLVRRGLVSEEQKQGTTFFIASKPASLLRLFEKEREELARKEGVAKELVDQLKPFFKSKFFSIPKLQFFEGRSGIDTLLYEHLEAWRLAMAQSDGIWWGYQDPTFVDEYREWLEFYWRQKTENEKVYLLSNEMPIEQELKKKVPNRVIKPVSKEIEFASTIWVCGDFVILLMTRQEPHYAFQLRDAVFAMNLRGLFRLLWVATP